MKPNPQYPLLQLKLSVSLIILLLFVFSYPAKAQKFEVYAHNCHMSNDDMTLLNRMGQFEAKFYNIVFNTTINDSAVVKVNLYGKQSEYNKLQKDVMNTTFTSGFYSPAVNEISLYKGDEFMKVMVHETSHNLLQYNMNNSPKWLNEGIATLFGYTEIKGDEIYYIRQNDHIKLVKDRMVMGTFNLAGYFSYRNADWYQKAEANYLYGVAYCLVYFFVKDDMENLQRMLVLMKKGYNTTDAIAKVFGSFAKFEKRFADFYKPEVSYRQ